MLTLGRRVAALVLATVTAGAVALVAAPTAAQAADDGLYTINIYRAGCHYQARGGTAYAATEKMSGGCAGHAWVRVRLYNGDLINWRHDPDYEVIWAGSPPNDIWWAEHKTQSNETPVRVTH